LVVSDTSLFERTHQNSRIKQKSTNGKNISRDVLNLTQNQLAAAQLQRFQSPQEEESFWECYKSYFAPELPTTREQQDHFSGKQGKLFLSPEVCQNILNSPFPSTKLDKEKIWTTKLQTFTGLNLNGDIIKRGHWMEISYNQLNYDFWNNRVVQVLQLLELVFQNDAQKEGWIQVERWKLRRIESGHACLIDPSIMWLPVGMQYEFQFYRSLLVYTHEANKFVNTHMDSQLRVDSNRIFPL